MNRPINVISLVAPNAGTSITEAETVDDGKIIGFAIYHNGLNNPGIVNAGLECNGDEILPLHHVDNFRNRETEYSKGYIPVNLEGGKKYTVKIVAETDAFTADTSFQAIFYYDLNNRGCN